jgi:hypothetical protein
MVLHLTDRPKPIISQDFLDRSRTQIRILQTSLLLATLHSILLSIRLRICLHICLSIRLRFRLSICLSIHPITNILSRPCLTIQIQTPIILVLSRRVLSLLLSLHPASQATLISQIHIRLLKTLSIHSTLDTRTATLIALNFVSPVQIIIT